MKVFQIGAAGGVGRRLARLLAAHGDQVSGMHRDPAQSQTVLEAGAVPAWPEQYGYAVQRRRKNCPQAERFAA